MTSREQTPPGSKEDEHWLAHGDRVVAQWTPGDTLESECMDIEPGGNADEATGMEIPRVEDGTMTERWHGSDALGMLPEIVALTTPGE